MDIARWRGLARRAAPTDEGFRRQPRIYWTDLVVTSAILWTGFVAAALGRGPLPARLLLATIAALALYRAVYFIHEIAHFGRRSLPGFSLFWHLVVGLPAGTPAFMATVHKDHHRSATYGSDADPEYAPVARWSRLEIALSVVMMVVIPPLLMARWVLLTPLSLLHPRLRRLVVERLSTLAIARSYLRPPPAPSARRSWWLAEAGAWLLGTAVVAAIVAGWLPFAVLLWWWGIQALALVLNQLKTLVTHAFERDGAGPMAMQIEDSVTLEGSWLTELVAPLGNRYHAAHHLVPDVPYHDLHRVHRALLDEPAYRATLRGGYLSALSWLWRRAAHPAPDRAAAPSLTVHDQLGRE